jgi:HSP20 family molecular chaperone IbpA
LSNRERWRIPHRQKKGNEERPVGSFSSRPAVDIHENSDEILLYTEVETSHYARNFTLSRELDTSRIDAQIQDGVLKERIPKQEASKPRKIPVQQISS